MSLEPVVTKNAKPEIDNGVARPPVQTVIFRGESNVPYVTVFSEAWCILQDLFKSAARREIFLLAGAVFGVLVINMAGQVYLNRWQGSFYRAIEHKNLSEIGHELGIFLLLVAVLLCVVVSQTWLHARLKISLREWLTKHLLTQWLIPARAYRLGISSDDGVNPDQRIQEDVRNFSEMSADLGMGLVQTTMLLLSFIGVLWAMSANISFEINNRAVSVPGYMVWMALLYAAIGSWVTSRIGRPLIALNEERYAREAEFRFSIVRVSENSEGVAFYSGERDERKLIDRNLNHVLGVMLNMAFASARLTWITSGYGWLMIVLPVLVALPGYLQGALDLGGLMMVVGAFIQVQNSLRWFVDNFGQIANWRAALHRVVVFRNAMEAIDQYGTENEHIKILPHAKGHLSFENTRISLIDGEVVIADATAHIYAGERVLIHGESGSGKSTLFRAVAGLWPWGSGCIRIPAREDMMFLPQKPYMPLGTLASALSYPKASSETDREKMKTALTRVNLDEFIPMLDLTDRWDKLMSLGQQQRLAFARVLVHRPKWVFLDEATSALDNNNQDVVMSLFTHELKDTTLLSIGHRDGLQEYHTRALHLTTTSSGTVLSRRPNPSTPSSDMKSRIRLWSRTVKIFGRSAPVPVPTTPVKTV